MPFLIGCFGLLFPRIVLFLVWLFGGGYLARAYPLWIWPALGFVFLPLTTLVFAYASNSLAAGGGLPPFAWLLVGLAVIFDLGCLKGGSRASSDRKRRHEHER